MCYTVKSMSQLYEQWSEMRRARRVYPSPFAKVERNAAIVRMYHDGMTVTHLAILYGLSKSRVSVIIARYK